MNEKMRIRIVSSIVAAVVPAAAWSVWRVIFADAHWIDSHWPMLCLVMAAAGVLVVVAIVLLFRADESPTVRTLAAIAIVAGAVVVPQSSPAQCGSQCEDYAASNLVAQFWNWAKGFFTAGDFAQGLSTTNQNPNQALSNNAAYGLQAVPPPNGPTPTLMPDKQK